MPTEATSKDANGIDRELAAVYGKLIEASDALSSPLQQLVRSQIDRARPYVRASVVLAAGVAKSDTVSLRHRRIQLAAALEMLFVAHHIHGLLLASHAEDMDKSVMGSTILAGDYCFSHSAILAAGTESPQVVAIFAQALKKVSEGRLRHLFEGLTNYDENDDLFVAGVEAATLLAELSEAEKNSILHYCVGLSDRSQPIGDADLMSLPTYQQNRWRSLRHQFSPSTRNGNISTTTSIRDMSSEK
jgi:hypothetical protein